MKALCFFTIVLCIFLGASSCKKSQEQPKTKTEEKVRKKLQVPVVAASGEATIKIVAGSGNILGIELTNKVPVRGMQFTITGVQMKEVRTTSRATDLLADFNNESGKVVILSTSDATISSGTGLIAEVVCDKKDSASLSGIKIIK